ncbi:MAG: chitobiase/beta-hexosaminidase C-terminal domain-containing protein, partial [Clostridia bacterium]|nr:chitobiase/beta-hexosaminidase C-terminal domain-containing protein [Clostridia bacterium]
EEYSVVFADFANGMVSLDSDYCHGDMLLTPDTPAAEGMVFDGWKVISNATGETLAILGRVDAEAIEVTEDLIVTAQWSPITHAVTFMDLSGEVLDVQTVEYGAAAQLPELTDLPEGMIFAGWSQDTQWWNVDGDMEVYPVAVYTETTTAPIHTGMMSIEGVQDTIELLCDEGASIYYTIDGSDPEPGMEDTFLYEGPIEVTETTTIRAIAVEENKNASQVVEVFFWYVEEAEVYPNHEAEHIGTYNVAAAAGETVAVEFRIENNPGLMGYLFYIDADPSVFTVADDYTAGTMCESGVLLLGPYTEGLGWQLLWFGTDAAEGDGVLCRLNLEVRENAESGVYPIKVGYSPNNTFDSDYIEQTLPGLTVGLSGAVEFKMGDVSGDGLITTKDVVMIAQSIIQMTEIPAERLALADVNRDGFVSLADAIYLARYIIGLEYLL